jgi:nucleolar protein 56
MHITKHVYHKYMEAIIVLTALGLIALDQSGKPLVFKRLEGGLTEIASKMGRLREGLVDLPELDDFLTTLHGMDVKAIRLADQELYNGLKKKARDIGLEIFHDPELKLDIESVITSAGYASLDEYRRLTREVYMLLAREKVKTEVMRRDLHIVHAVRALDDLEKQKNQIYERVRDWYGLHFPELSDLVPDPVDYMKIAAQPVIREEVLAGKASPPDVKRSAEILETMERSMGSPISVSDAEAIARLARLGLEVDKLVRDTGEYIRGLVSLEAPNLMALVGPLLASRLISLAGGMEKLARMPASTIQMLGAEKALFRFFRTGRGAPKHGVIFQHPYVHSASRWQRGKIARAIAAKISIAAKIDYFSKEDRSAALVRALEARIDEIKKKYAEPPPKSPVKVSKRRRR